MWYYVQSSFFAPEIQNKGAHFTLEEYVFFSVRERIRQ